jgi:outer membrane lipoprotein-sorting protein
MKIKFNACTLSMLSMMLVMSLFTSTARAANVKPVAAMLSAEQVADKNAAARGGLSAWLAVQSMAMTGKMDAGKIKPPAKPAVERMEKGRRPKPVKQEEGKVVELPFVLEMQRPHKTRLEIEFAGQTAVQVFDGTNGWKLRPFLGRREVESYSPDEMKTAAQQQDMEGLLIDYASKGTKLSLDKFEQVEGKDAYKLSLTMKDGQVKHVWVDAKTFLDVKMDGTRILSGKLRTVATFFRNYKAVAGLQMPYLIETNVEGIKGSEKINIDYVTVNAKLDAKRFTKPE